MSITRILLFFAWFEPNPVLPRLALFMIPFHSSPLRFCFFQIDPLPFFFFLPDCISTPTRPFFEGVLHLEHPLAGTFFGLHCYPCQPSLILFPPMVGTLFSHTSLVTYCPVVSPLLHLFDTSTTIPVVLLILDPGRTMLFQDSHKDRCLWTRLPQCLDTAYSGTFAIPSCCFAQFTTCGVSPVPPRDARLVALTFPPHQFSSIWLSQRYSLPEWGTRTPHQSPVLALIF